MKKVVWLVAVGLLMAVFPSARATVLVQSTFDAGDEGWRVGELLSLSGSSVPTFVAAGGNPSGFVRTSDLFGFSAYHAPSTFLGNQSAAYGGSIHLEEQVLSSDGILSAMVVLSNGGLLLQFRTLPPGTTWTPYEIPLLASAGWEIASDGVLAGAPATELQLQQVLANLTLFSIDADWRTGADQVDLDNVRLSSPSGISGVPDAGGSFMLLGVALLGLFGCLHILKKRPALP